MEDRELVQKLLAKDEETFRYFYGAYAEKLYKVSAFLLGYHDPDAEDIAQEVFLVALKRLPQFEFRSSLYHWLHCICTYLCYERIRKRQRLVVSLDAELEAMSEPVAFRHSDREQEERQRQKMLEVVEAQKQLLGEPCRSLLDLRDGQNKSYAELAEILKVPIGTVNSRLARCKEALKSLVARVLKAVLHG